MHRRIELGDVFVKIMMFCIFAALISVFIASLSFTINNENNRITEGIIVDSQYYSGGTYYNSDKNGGHMRSDPPSYWFKISGEKDGKTVEYWLEVTQEEYSLYSVGDYFRR